MTALIEESLREATDQECFFVEFDWREKTGKLAVYIDSETNVSLAQCQKVSRALSRQLEENDLLDANYALEVSSPGLDRPLKLHRQYVKNIGRPIKIHTVDGMVFEGVLDQVDEERIVTVPEGKNNKKGPREIVFGDIDKTFVQIRFK